MNFVILFQRTITILLQFWPIEASATGIQLVRGFVAAAVKFNYKDTAFPNTWTHLWKNQALSFPVFCACQGTMPEKTSNCISSKIISAVFWSQSFQFCSQVLYSLSVLCRQEQDTENWCPFPTVRTCLDQKNWQKICSTVPIFVVLLIEGKKQQRLVLHVEIVLWRFELCILQCSSDLASQKVYYW